MPTRNLALAGALVLLAACGSGPSSSTASVVDSAGVMVVTNTAAQLVTTAQWTLADTPALKIETPDDGSFTLFHVGAVVWLSRGRIAVANGGSHDILVFGPDGSLVSRFGKQGAGPGEFQSIGSMAALDQDSIAVFDWGNHRLSVFDPDGHLGHEVDLTQTIKAAGGWFAGIHSLKDGDLVLFTGGSFLSEKTPHQGTFRTESESMRIHSDGTVLASYGRFPGPEVFDHVHGLSGSPIFGAVTDAVTMGDDLVVGTEAAPEFRVFGPDGTLTRIIRWPDHDRRVTQAQLDSLWEALVPQVPKAQTAAVHAQFTEIPHADEEPPYRTLVPSDDGVWVGQFNLLEAVPGASAAPAPARSWFVFDSDGTLKAVVHTPAGFDPNVVRGRRILGVFKDTMGVESIRTYALHRE